MRFSDEKHGEEKHVLTTRTYRGYGEKGNRGVVIMAKKKVCRQRGSIP